MITKDSRSALALFLFLFSAYVLTASGHTYSPDEEAILYVAQSFVTRGEFNIPNPNQYPVVGGQRGIGGKIYSGTGMLTSMLVVPFFVVGDLAARSFDPRWQPYVIRFLVVPTFNALLSALSSVILLAWLRRMGLSRRVSFAVVLVFALATMTWLYARTLYSETLLALCWLLACYALRVYHDARALRWMSIAGLAAGLSILTKIQGALILPALAIYFVALEFPRVRSIPAFIRASILPSLAFVIPLVLCLGVFGYYNLIRFGSFLESGYGDVPADFPILVGIYGQLLSSGKSVFLYALPIVLGVIAFPRFVWQFRAEALLCLLLIATVIIFHARVWYWAGDGAWGPRYLAATMPFWILPLGAVLSRWWRHPFQRAVVITFVSAGVLINVLGMTINFDTYLNQQPVERIRHFEPAGSPLLAQWNLLTARARAWSTALASSNPGIVLISGMLPSDAEDDLLPRYFSDRALILVKSNMRQPLTMDVVAFDYRPEGKPRRELHFLANGNESPAQQVPEGDAGILHYRVQLPSRQWLPIEIVTLGGALHGTSPMGDELGVHVQSIRVTDATSELDLQDIAIPPMPIANPRAAWGWFFAPAHLHFDFLAWYLFFSGLESADALKLAVPLYLCSIMGALWAGTMLWRRLVDVSFVK